MNNTEDRQSAFSETPATTMPNTDGLSSEIQVEGSVEGAQVETHDTVTEIWVHLNVTWKGETLSLELADSDRVYDLKALLQSLTDVPPERQKILGLVKGKLPPDEETIRNLNLSNGKKSTLIGTPEGKEVKDPSRMCPPNFGAAFNTGVIGAELEELPDVINDLDVDVMNNPAAAEAYRNDKRNKRKVQEATKNLKLNVMNPPREGKKLLVLDLDYTILDTKPLVSGALPPTECARPRLHEFLEAIYPHYDICIWSQTSWIWLETKLVELGMVGSHHNYKIAFVLDKTSMFTVFSVRDNQQFTHSVKALQIIWNHFPQYNARNTIHVDDLSRNFALNPRSGLKISAYKDAFTPRAAADRELDKVAKYMVHIASQEDFLTLDHHDWKKVVRGLP
ncbi:HAD IIID h [Rickenella mellea]|uniref:protein-serine/threonine phosphatase n=1 Tax=Rickenella mellea TaxID=50990 RepID=A0A4Y7QDI6_9AGAM|nr:HAD IIID h [Rickenella mellea]